MDTYKLYNMPYIPLQFFYLIIQIIIKLVKKITNIFILDSIDILAKKFLNKYAISYVFVKFLLVIIDYFIMEMQHHKFIMKFQQIFSKIVENHI